MSQTIDSPPSPLSKGKLALYHLVLFYLASLGVCWWLIESNHMDWGFLLQHSTLNLAGTMHIILACMLLAWQALRLKAGYAKLRECSEYENYLDKLFDTRERHRPAQNASRLEVVRKMRQQNSQARGTIEHYQQANYGITQFGVLILFFGSLLQLGGQFS
ncbi:hypothetical protein [Kangiella shandongensis]|uniref:hypothetical protein n=1 Tax=Kangiella shandongensis TaxID=2763258 RepID=UPI001CBA8583|nr:hypothetical protein [Kangiella shandongensis]